MVGESATRAIGRALGSRLLKRWTPRGRHVAGLTILLASNRCQGWRANDKGRCLALRITSPSYLHPTMPFQAKLARPCLADLCLWVNRVYDARYHDESNRGALQRTPYHLCTRSDGGLGKTRPLRYFLTARRCWCCSFSVGSDCFASCHYPQSPRKRNMSTRLVSTYTAIYLRCASEIATAEHRLDRPYRALMLR